MNKIRENAKKYFDEELSGEPLYQDMVIDWLTEFAEQQVKLFTNNKRCFCGAVWDGIECTKCGFDASEADIY